MELSASRAFNFVAEAVTSKVEFLQVEIHAQIYLYSIYLCKYFLK